MLILTIRTDKPEAEIGLFLDNQEIVYKKWPAHRQLAETLHEKIKQLLDGQSKSWSDLQGIVAFQGPGSFTGLRIGLSVANALAQSLGIPVIGSSGDDWLKNGVENLKNNKGGRFVMPEYGAGVYTTKPKK